MGSTLAVSTMSRKSISVPVWGRGRGRGRGRGEKWALGSQQTNKNKK